jgi:DNA-binding transcriptional LysR family regulator
MTLNQIRYVLALCEERNFSRAAKRCGVAQPSLTKAIKRLEAEIGGCLFDRACRRTRMSEFGCAILPYLQRIDRAATEMSRRTERIHPDGFMPRSSDHRDSYAPAAATGAIQP